MNEMVHTFVVVPHHSKVIYNEGKPDRAIVVAEHREGARDGKVSIGLKMLEQPLLAQSSRLW
jgi:hypothetical protein